MSLGASLYLQRNVHILCLNNNIDSSTFKNSIIIAHLYYCCGFFSCFSFLICCDLAGVASTRHLPGRRSKPPLRFPCFSPLLLRMRTGITAPLSRHTEPCIVVVVVVLHWGGGVISTLLLSTMPISQSNTALPPDTNCLVTLVTLLSEEGPLCLECKDDAANVAQLKPRLRDLLRTNLC